MKVFISQPMAGKTEKQIREEREKLEKDLKKMNCEVIDTIFNLEKGKSPMYYLAKSIELLDKADIVIFMREWDKARGCRAEYQIAKDYGKCIVLL